MFARPRNSSFGRPPWHTAGTVPWRWLLFKYKYLNSGLGLQNNASGMVPVKAVENSSKSSNFKSPPRHAGMVPERWGI